MNKKQFTFYVFILTFGIACGDGSVKESEDTTNTPKVDNLHKEDKLPKVGNPPIGDKPIKVSQPSNYDNAINYDFTKETDNKFLKDLQYKLKDMEKKMNDDKMNKELDDAEEKMILETYKAFMILMMQ